MAKKQEINRNICEINLHAKNAEEYGVMYREHFLEQYKVVIQGVDYSSKWKHIVNNYFLTINTFLIAAIGLSVTRDQIVMLTFTHQVIPFIGVLMALAWFFIARGYNDVLEAKFAILHCIEKDLPLALYMTEWEILKASHRNPSRIASTHISVPVIFFIFYLLIFFFLK